MLKGCNSVAAETTQRIAKISELLYPLPPF